MRSFNDAAPGAPAVKWPVSTAGGDRPRWRRDGRELIFGAPDGKLMSVSVRTGSTFDAGVPVALFDTGGPDFGYDVSPDGQRFVISRVLKKGTPGPVNVCLNWLAGMKK